MTSETPRTDVVVGLWEERLGGGTILAVPVDFARHLERELAAMTARAEAAERECDVRAERERGYLARAQSAEADRDSLRAELDRLTTLRPASEWDGVAEVLWFWQRRGLPQWHSGRLPERMRYRETVLKYYREAWLPIPTPKEAK